MHMAEMHKITAFIPAELLASARAYTGEGISETLRIGLQQLVHERACRKLLDMRGKVKFEHDWRELRGKDDDE